MTIFNEDSLRDAIVRTWGPAGAHIDVFDALVSDRDRAPGVPPMHNAALRSEQSENSRLRFIIEDLQSEINRHHRDFGTIGQILDAPDGRTDVEQLRRIRNVVG